MQACLSSPFMAQTLEREVFNQILTFLSLNNILDVALASGVVILQKRPS